MEQDGLIATKFFTLATTTTASTASAWQALLPVDANGIPQYRAMLIRGITVDHNMTLDGTTPTVAAGGGYPLLATDTGGFWVWGTANILRFRAIAKTATGNINVITFN